MSSVNNAWKELSKHSNMVPVLGTGFRRWVTDNELPEPFYNWRSLIEFMAWGRDIPANIPPGNASLASTFESVIVRAKEPEQSASEAENKLIASLATCWEVPTDAARESATFQERWSRFHDAHPSGTLLDLNIDRLLVGEEQCRRHAMGTIRFDIGGRRIWYPHGVANSRAYNSAVTLSTQRYGQAVRRLAKYFEKWMRNNDLHAVEHWISVGLYQPLVLLGVGLGPDEWDLWWLIHMRRRYWVNQGGSPPVFRLTCEKDAHRESRPALASGIDIISLDGGKTWDEAWEKYLTEVNPKRRVHG